MIELQISPNVECHLHLKDRLEKMSLARKVAQLKEAKIPILKEGPEVYMVVKILIHSSQNTILLLTNGTRIGVINMINLISTNNYFSIYSDNSKKNRDQRKIR